MATEKTATEFVVYGDIRTMDQAGTSARAMLVRDGRIAALSQCRDLEGAATHDFGERVVIPGFCDPHSHVETAGATLAMVDLRAPEHGSVQDVLDEISTAIAAGKGGPDEFLVAQANLFFDQKLAEKRYPLLSELDRVTGDRPIVIQAGGHVSILNSKAMELAQIGRFSTGDAGTTGAAIVDLDEHGLPTGVVSEIDGYLPIPQPDAAEFETLIERAVTELYLRYGVTTLGDISHTPESLTALSKVAARSRSVRVHTALWAPHTLDLDQVIDWRARFPGLTASDFFTVDGLKVFADGGYSAHNAATLTPYLPEFALEDDYYGQVNMERAAIARAVAVASAAGLNLLVHTNGERAQIELAEGVLLARDNGHTAVHVRSEHAGNLNTSSRTTDAWRRAGLVPVSQAVFLYNFGDFIPALLGEPARHGQFHFRRLLDEGWRVSSTSDYLLGSELHQTNPLFGVWCAVKRQGFGGEVIEPEQSVSVDEAIRMHTVHAAEAMGLADTRGSLENGKYADFLVLDRNPFTVAAADDLLDVAVDQVWTNGVLVHSKAAR